MRKYIFVFLFLFFLPLVAGEITQSEYYFIIEENGRTVVAINLIGSGEITLPLPSDVLDIEVEGALYIMENNQLTIAIGSTSNAAIAYRTDLLTQKSGENWVFSSEIEQDTSKQVIIVMPENTVIASTNPPAQIQSGDLTKIYITNPDSIQVNYKFSQEVQQNNNFIFVYIITAAFIIIIIFFILSIKKITKKIKPRQEQIMQTLTENESSIINLLLESKKPLKRSFIEKKLEIAKSSLATTLQNLEKKKLIHIDKTYNTHLIKLQDWFEKI